MTSNVEQCKSALTVKLANRVEKITPSQTLAIAAKANQLKKQGIDIISLSAGEPDFDTPITIKQAAERALSAGDTKYTPVSGTLELKKAISEKLASENKLNYAPDQIVVTCGAKHALYNTLQVLVQEGDEVIIPSPYWLSYPEMVVLAGGTPVILKTRIENQYSFSIDELRKQITPKTKVLILNSPSNPTGAVFQREFLLEIIKLAKQHSFLILSDEIYEKLIFDGLQHESIGALDPEILSRTITVGGASKCYAMTGWRLGFLAAPKYIAAACDSLQSHSTSNPTSFSQAAYTYALKYVNEEVQTMKRAFEKRRDLMWRLLSEIPQIKPFKPNGAFYFFVDISKTELDSMTFTNRLIEEARVAVIPGISFGHDEAVRLSFATSEAQIENGCQRIREWLKKI